MQLGELFPEFRQPQINRMDGRKKPDLIVIDESHHLTGGTTWGRVIDANPQARLLGVTATPIRLDGRGLGKASGGFCDVLIEGKPMRWLIDNGYLCDYRIFAPQSEIDLSGVKTIAGDYQQDKLAEAMDKPKITGDAVKHYSRLIDGKRAICFCVDIKHAEHVAEQFRLCGIPSEPLDGTMTTEARKAAISRFKNGETLVMTSVGVVSEGFDLPAIEAAIMLRPTQSLSLYLQQAGRALRAFPGKTCAYIIDHVGNAMRHGFPDDEREWMLDPPKKKKRKAEEVEDVTIHRCPRDPVLIFRNPARCEGCNCAGTARRREIEQEDGQLVEITPEMRQAAQKARKKEEGECRTLEDFIALGQARGYKAGWAIKRFELRQGRR